MKAHKNIANAVPKGAMNFIQPSILQQYNTIQAQPSSTPKTKGTLPTGKKEKSFKRFNLSYDPKGPAPSIGTLTITSKVYFKFKKKVPKADRAPFEKDFEKSVEDAWSKKHLLVLNDPALKPYQTQVVIDIVKVNKAKDAHFTINVIPTKKGYISNVQDSKFRVNLDADDATDNDEHSSTRADFFHRVGDFDFDSSAINPRVQKGLDKVTDFLNKVPKGVRNGTATSDIIGIEYTGRASSEGNKNYNKKLSNRRIETVENHVNTKFPDLVAITFNNDEGEKHTKAEAKFRRVDVKIDLPTTIEPEKVKQITAAHEAGHMWGLDDEYIKEKDGRFEGDKQRLDAIIRNTVDDAAAEEMRAGNNESIMSHGMEVKRGHYFSFVLHLRDMMQNNHWKVQ